MYRYKINIFLFLLIFVFACSIKERDLKPNIVLVLADDMGYSDISAYGGEITTPSIDRLAENGVRFTNFYNSSRCCPSCALIIMTIKHANRSSGILRMEY